MLRSGDQGSTARTAPAALARLASVPHRFFFLAGAIQLVAVALWWLADLGGRYAGLYGPIAWTVPAPWAHGFLMVFTVFPFFVFGFLMTAMPNWTGVPVARRAHLAAGLPMVLGVASFYAGLALDARLALAGVALLVTGWLTGVTALARVVRANRGRDRHAAGLTALLGVGALAAASFGGWLATGAGAFAIASRHAGLWLFLLPLFLTVAHRLVPFFSSRVIEAYVTFRPRWSIRLLVAGCAAHFALELASAGAWLWVVDAPMAAWVGFLALKWGLRGSFRARLLVMLHLSLVALAAALALYALDSVTLALAGSAPLGLGPLHALAIGYFTAQTVAMVSRVSLGHSGRALEADSLTWRAFLGVLAVALLRVLSELWIVPPQARVSLALVAGLLWLAVFAPWAARYVPIYLAPRADGKPG